MNIKILLPKTFHGTDAIAEAELWLETQMALGLVPLCVVAKGTNANVTLSGPEGGAIVFVKK